MLAWSVWWNSICLEVPYFYYCRTYNVSVCLYIEYITCGSAPLYIKTLSIVLALSVAATVTNIKIRYDVTTPQFATVTISLTPLNVGWRVVIKKSLSSSILLNCSVWLGMSRGFLFD